MTKAIAVAERYEDQRKLQWEQFYWNKMTTSGQIAQNIMSTGANLLTGGANGIQNVISAMGQSAQIGSQIAGQQATALQGQIGMIGSIGTMVGRWAGQERGLEFARQLYGVSGMTAPTYNSASQSSYGMGTVDYSVPTANLGNSTTSSGSMYGLNAVPL
jgi:hypothetical protein